MIRSTSTFMVGGAAFSIFRGAAWSSSDGTGRARRLSLNGSCRPGEFTIDRRLGLLVLDWFRSDSPISTLS